MDKKCLNFKVMLDVFVGFWIVIGKVRLIVYIDLCMLCKLGIMGI